MNSNDLIEFEKDIETIYKTGVIRGPIHLRNGNEKELVRIFKHVQKEDYVFTTWASHLEALLHGVPAELVKKKILEGKSITLNFPEYNVYSSAIVGGICPVAVGAAWAIKRKREKRHVWAFIGDMTVMTGIANESIRYCDNFDLPITFVVGDNGKSVGTPTDAAWGESCEDYVSKLNSRKVVYYKYNLTYPHSGVGIFVSF